MPCPINITSAGSGLLNCINNVQLSKVECFKLQYMFLFFFLPLHKEIYIKVYMLVYNFIPSVLTNTAVLDIMDT